MPDVCGPTDPPRLITIVFTGGFALTSQSRGTSTAAAITMRCTANDHVTARLKPWVSGFRAAMRSETSSCMNLRRALGLLRLRLNGKFLDASLLQFVADLHQFLNRDTPVARHDDLFDELVAERL